MHKHCVVMAVVDPECGTYLPGIHNPPHKANWGYSDTF